ncbi:hypothetical protein KW801_03175 [Candidatus Saccharibacteria bacterium]|nr:hypothetical protein [Candidatus Saccharibacteria bacterium]
MIEKVADPRTEEELLFDFTDTAPGFAGVLHQFGLIESDRHLSTEEAKDMAAQAYWAAVQQMEENPKAVLEHRNKFSYDLEKLKSQKS